MSISDKFLNIIKKSMLKQQDGEIKKLKKEKKEINKKIKTHITKNRPLFKKIRSYDFFNIDTLTITFFCSAFLTFAYLILMILITGTALILSLTGLLNPDLNGMSINEMFYIMSPALLGSSLFLTSGTLMIISSIFNMKGKKGELLNILDKLKIDRKEILHNISLIKDSKNKIDELINQGKDVDKFKDEEWLQRSIDSEVLKVLPLYLSDDEMKAVFLNAKSNSITYYTLIDIIEKIKNNKNYKECVEIMREMSTVKE